MRWFQAALADGSIRLGIFEQGRATLFEPHQGVSSALDLFSAVDEGRLEAGAWLGSARVAAVSRRLDWDELASGAGEVKLAVPLAPPEVWGAGVTYKRSAEFREEGTGFYDKVYSAERPELFFKASAWRCVSPGQPIGRRRDSGFTATEPELALVLGRRGTILGFTLANDVSAWDIERENPLYLPQSKIYNGCFSFGPVVVTPDELLDPYALELRCIVERNGREVFSGQASTAQLKRRFPELVEWFLRSNEIRAGTVLSTGTGIIQPLEAGLEPGDVVTISCPEIGALRNPVAWV
jgi:2-dehydro-3-deoxy-D-arabinonate dehydratase